MSDWNLKHPFIDNVLDPVSIVIGILVAIPVLWTWWDVVVGRRRLHKIWLKKACATTGKLPAVLVVDLLAGPGCASAMVGAELANISCKVMLFQNDMSSNTYVNFGPLRHPRF